MSHELEPERKESERRFHDARFEHEVRGPVHKFYAVTEASTERLREEVSRRSRGKEVLEYGCGPHPDALALARDAATITGIDISGVAARRATEAAQAAGLRNVRFVVMDAEQMEFEDDSFDLVFGTSILHHLELERSLSEIVRVLRPGGTAVFLEPLGHNPAINLYRRLTPRYRTPDEHPLMMADLRLASSFFGEARYSFHHFLSLLAVPLRGARPFRPVLRGLDLADRTIFRVPGAGRLAWFVVMVLERPAPRG